MTNPPTVGVSYLVRRMLNKSFDGATCHLLQPPRRTSALLVANLPRIYTINSEEVSKVTNKYYVTDFEVFNREGLEVITELFL